MTFADSADALPPPPTAQEPSDLDRLLREQPGLQQTIRRLVGEAVRSTFCDSSALVVTTDGVVVSPTTSEAAGWCDAGQFEQLWQDENGPALQSLRSRRDLRTSDLRHDSRWPRWGPRAAGLGLGSLVTKQLLVRSQTFAVLVLCAESQDAYDQRDLEVAEIFARYANVALTSAHVRDALVVASESRQTIGIAEGILMQRHQLGVGAAFTSLRARGVQDHLTLLQTAERISRGGASSR